LRRPGMTMTDGLRIIHMIGFTESLY
jgi:hypothetical protein